MPEHKIIISRRVLLLTMILSIFGAGDWLHSAFAQPFLDEKPEAIKPDTTSGLRAFYQALDYNWTNIEEGVPPFILESIPEDINESVSTKVKKRSFFMGLLPMILMA
ncbi:MAG: hypothetical protein GTN46_05910, partial [Gammaproteobacteria bacterium]|nr:hypothetical protein [Gammaproteobacteria bacterium]NIO61879.1 hypothetical protein [Gammaproteobacteria bacterium]NIT05615.1 hypothetical protein [Gammaproteobacteria bacterium]NIT41046.1 hypothetical protein [Gammaproteobacteria bacterium]